MATSHRRFLVGGNWKMNGSLALIKELVPMLKQVSNEIQHKPVDVVIAPPALYLTTVQNALSDSSIQLAVQNMHGPAVSGAFTGELGVQMLVDLSIPWVILGHSERRTLFHETDALIAQKVALALSHGRQVIACLGETLQERDADQTQQVTRRQLKAIVDGVSQSQNQNHWEHLVIAYEPVWAIGTGRVATPEQAQQVHADLRAYLGEIVSLAVAEKLRILYGGSVTAATAKSLAAQPDVDGFLVGGASLKLEFGDIARARI